MARIYLDAALETLRHQVKDRHPQATVWWIADPKHSRWPYSDHSAEPDGDVDALDFKIDQYYTRDHAWYDIQGIIESRDYRVAYIIFEGRILSTTINPWEWRKYDGKDSHYGHWHLSRNDKREDDNSLWNVGDNRMTPAQYAGITKRISDVEAKVDAIVKTLLDTPIARAGEGVSGHTTLRATIAWRDSNDDRIIEEITTHDTTKP